MSSIQRNNSALLKIFLANGARVDARDVEGNTPLILATKLYYWRNRNELMTRLDLLLSQGADVNATNLAGEFPLGIVSMARDDVGYDIASRLIQKGADIKRIKDTGAVVWHAFEENNLKMMKLFAKHCPNLDDKDPHGRTMLYLAAEAGALAKALILLDSGANVNARSGGGQTPLKVASSDEMRKLLISRGGVE